MPQYAQRSVLLQYVYTPVDDQNSKVQNSIQRKKAAYHKITIIKLYKGIRIHFIPSGSEQNVDGSV